MRTRWLGSVGLIVLAGMTLALAGCSGSEEADDGRPLVVASTTIIADLAQTLGGDAVRVVGIMKTGEDPHIYSVRPNDARLIDRADLILVNGLHLEATLGQVIDKQPAAKVVALAERASFEPIAEDDGGAPDPHVWMDPTIWAQCAEVTRDALIALAPDHAADITERTAAYLSQLSALEADIRAMFAEIPEGQRVIITSHDAFAYFGRAFGVEVHGVVGISTEQQPRPQDIQALEKLVRDRGVRAVFIETSTSLTLNQLVEKIAANTGASVGGTLYSDSLGGPGSGADTYVGMMRHNATTIGAALAGGSR